MRLKFKPSIDNNSSSNYQSSKPAPIEETSGAGKGMLLIAFVLFIVVLTVLFQNEIDQRINPNRTINSTQNEQGEFTIQLRQNHAGHYVSRGGINGHKVTFLLDTGATDVAIPMDMQRALNLIKGHKITISTANGKTTGYQTIISELSIGPLKLHNVKAILTPNLEHILLGMSALKQFEFTQRGNMLYLKHL